MIKRSSRAVAFEEEPSGPSPLAQASIAASVTDGAFAEMAGHLMYNITGPAERKLCLSSVKREAFRPLLTDRRQILPVCSFPETPHPTVCSL